MMNTSTAIDTLVSYLNHDGLYREVWGIDADSNDVLTWLTWTPTLPTDAPYAVWRAFQALTGEIR